MKNIALIGLMVVVPGLALAQGSAQPGSPYAGEETRAIKSLSEDDIAELRRGGGWGLAKAAELNGMPGPAHLLELKDQIPLDPEQVAAIQAIYDALRVDAIAEGERFVALEQELEDHFRNRTITDQILRRLLADIAGSRRNLRYIHLATHISTPDLLMSEQISRYNTLRGYRTDPCANVPEGHDAAKWREHNGCS